MSNSLQLMDCSPPGSPVHEISQARIVEWLPFPTPGDCPNAGIKPASPAWQADSFTTEPHEKSMSPITMMLNSVTH